jgi:hypothetical protein
MQTIKKYTSGILTFAILLGSFPVDAFAATNIRQEVNIVDAYLYAPASTFATSSEIIAITDTNYSSPVYYFEAVASSTSGTTATAKLVNATSSAVVATITMTSGNTYTRYRSSAFMPNSSSTVEYKVLLGNEAVGKGLLAARVVVLQNPDTLSKTETQIEIGNNELITSTATTSLASPKYWYYDSTKWDGSPSFYAEVTYGVVNGAVASSSAYAVAGTYTVTLPAGTASSSIGLWGGGGAGGSATSNTGGGSGGAGGSFASSTVGATTSTYTLLVGAGAPAPAATAKGAQGATSTWGGNVIVAGGGAGGALNAGGTTTASSFGSVGDSKFAGGNGANGRNTATQYGGGGGGGADSSGAGNNAGADASAGAAKGFGGAGAAKNVTGGSAGTTGGTAGGGGSGGNASNATDRAGGAGGVGRAALYHYMATGTVVLQVSDGTGDGFTGWADVANTYMVTSATVPLGTPQRYRSSAFTPVSGRNYRLAIRKNDSRTTVAVYNAKIVVVSAAVGDLSFGNAINNNTQGVTSYNFQNNGNYIWCWANGTSAITGMTFNGSALTQLGTNQTHTAFARTINQWGIATTTSATSSLTTTGGANQNSGCISIINADTSNPTTNPTNYNSTTATPSMSITTTADKAYLVAHGLIQNYSSDGSGTVKVLLINTDPNYSVYRTTSAKTPAGSASININSSGGEAAIQGVAINPAATGALTLLQPQYLLANDPLSTGTGLQNALTSWLSTEWNTTNAYVFQVEAANGSASVVELDTAAGVQVTNSVVTSPDNRGTSTSMCMPADGNLDIKATTNNNDIYAARILVDVGGTAASCGTPAVAAPNPKFFHSTGSFILTSGLFFLL